jgi:hypothetical protein
MAGKKQHYLPQFLQRGFSSSTSGKQTWLFRKNAPAKEVGIRDVGVEDYFYSDLADTTLDDIITRVETDEFSGLILALRDGTMPPDGSSRLAAFILHLEVRSRNLRGGVQETLEKMWSMTAVALQSPGVLPGIFKTRSKNYPGALIESSREQLKSQNLPLEFAEPLALIVGIQLSNSTDEFFRPFWDAALPILRTVLRSKLEQAAKQAQQNALKQDIAPEVRAKQYQQLSFQNVKLPSDDLLLGDSAVVFHVSGDRALKPFLDKEDEIVAVLLPIAANRVVIGSNSDYAIDQDKLRSGSARTAHRFFIAAANSQANSNLTTEIGTDALPLRDDELGEIVKMVIDEQLG